MASKPPCGARVRFVPNQGAWSASRQLAIPGVGGRSQGLYVDLFAGGGGASTGIELATGRSSDIAINHNPVAIATHQRNHPAAIHCRRRTIFAAFYRHICTWRSMAFIIPAQIRTGGFTAYGSYSRSDDESLVRIRMDYPGHGDVSISQFAHDRPCSADSRCLAAAPERTSP